jgi:hypothetical protein
MPTKLGIRALLLVEDEALERFIRRVLLSLGFQTRDIRVKRCPKGQGSAKDWVRRNYPQEARSHRSRASYQENIALIVGTDADELEVVERVRTLDDALVDAGLEIRQPDEKIFLVVPKWNIETWLVHLNGDEVDESRDDYKNDRRIRNVAYAKTAVAFVERYRKWKQGNVVETTPPSMIMTFEEMKRFGL